MKNITGIIAGAVVAYLLLSWMQKAMPASASQEMVWVNGQLVPLDSLFQVSGVTTMGSQGI